MTLVLQLDVQGDDDEDETRSLYRWLIDDPVAIRQAELSWTADGSAPAGSMGGPEIIEAVVQNGIALGSLLVSYLQWKQASRRRDNATMEIRHGDRVYSLRGTSEESVAEVIRAIERQQADESHVA
jgi:hypothetical protein